MKQCNFLIWILTSIKGTLNSVVQSSGNTLNRMVSICICMYAYVYEVASTLYDVLFPAIQE